MGGVLARPRYGPLAGALVCWFLSLWPTLLPRGGVVQGVVSGACAAIGWLLGLVAGHLLHRLLRRLGRPLTPRARRIAWRALAVAALVLFVLGLFLWFRWQGQQRDVMGMADLSLLDGVMVVVVSLIVLAVFVLIGRLVVVVVRWFDGQVAKLVPSGWARATATISLVAIVLIVFLVGRRQFVEWADRSFGSVNDTTPEGIIRPTSSSVSGGPGSLVDWDTLGAEGQRFTGSATPVDELAAFQGDADVMEPVRVYVGLDSAATDTERTALAMQELERTGAYERSVLVVATATGTGWIDPDAATALEMMHGGDTAIVTLQYSFLPSWIAFLLDPSNAAKVGNDLFLATRQRWLDLPEDDRPRFVVYGESLGSYGAEAAFDGEDVDDSLQTMLGSADAVLLSGPTASNPVWSQLVNQRDDGSPSWRPELARYPQLRVSNTADDIARDDPAWTDPRILYMHHPTDPVGTWSPKTLWWPPGWTQNPTGYGVPSVATWFPLLTWVQETRDLMAGFSAEPGFGHDYGIAYPDAWAAVAPPEDGWSDSDTERLLAALVPE